MGLNFKNIVLSIVLFLHASLNAQVVIVTPYPVNAQPITRALTTGDLTVRIAFAATCNDDTVTIKLPPSVAYIAGSVAKTGGSLTIAEADITNLRSPRFAISNVTGTGDITFTITRKAGCGSLASGKDTVMVTGSCGTTTESSPVVNTYNLLAPALSIAPPATLTGAIVGTVANRTISITNGGNGDMDTLYYYVVYPSSGIKNTAMGNAITANGISFTSYKTSGDTLFYKIFGATLFGGDNLLTNGESVTIVEPIKVLKCNAPTNYAGGWGVHQDDVCQWANGTGSVAMAGGVPILTSVTHTLTGYVDKCTPFDINFTATNGGTGNDTAAGMYSITLRIGYNTHSIGAIGAYNPALFTYSNPRINGNVVSAFSTVGNIASINLDNLFPTTGADPDGPGGLTDLDGDGFYDDLPRGESVTYTMLWTWKCNLACPYDKIYYAGGNINYTNMCGDSKQTEGRHIFTPIYESSFTGTGYLPANILGGSPFRLTMKEGHYLNQSMFDNANTRYLWKLTLPAGYSVSGTGMPTYGVAASTYIQVADTIFIQSTTNSLRGAGINLVLTCGSGGVTTFDYTLTKIQDITTNCICQGDLICGTLSTNAFCPGPCPAGPSNLIPVVRRANGSLGWTDATMATRQVASAISAFDLSKALFHDTIEVTSTARQSNAATNLHLELNVAKAGTVNKLTPVDVTTTIYRAGLQVSTCTLTTFTDNSTATVQIMDWDLIGTCLPAGGLLAGDSIHSVARYVVAINSGLAQNDIQSGGICIHYNLVGGVKEHCVSPVAEMYLVGTTLVDGRNAWNSSGCNVFTYAGGSHLARRFNTSGVLYQDEYRPMFFVDSVVVTFPDTYVDHSASNTFGGGAMTPNNINGNIYTYINPGTWNPISLTVTNAYGGAIYYRSTPTCKTATGMVHNVKTYIKDYYYAFAGAGTYPSTYEYVLSGGSGNTAGNPAGRNQGIAYSTATKPDLKIQNLTGDVVGTKQQETWDVEVRNDGALNAPYTWLSLEKTSGTGITIDSVTLLPSDTKLTGITYGTKEWFELSTGGIASSANQKARIFFKYANCTEDSLKVKTGWNCSAYPSPNPDTDANACSFDSAFVKVIPANSQIQLSVIRQPGNGVPIALCTTDSVLVRVNSAQYASIINPIVEVYLPVGVKFKFPFKIEYPYGSGNYQNADTTVIPGGYRIKLNSHSEIAKEGIPGTGSTTNSANRQVKIVLKYMSDCDIVSGTPLRFVVYANKICGEPVFGNGIVNTNNINIQGVVFNGIAGLKLSLPIDTFKCKEVRTLSLSTTPFLASSQFGDTIIYTLPKGLAYKGNFIAGSNCTNCAVSSFAGIGGTTIVKVKIDSGIASNTQMNYSFDVLAESTGVCDSSEITAQAKRNIAPLTCDTVKCKNSSAIISSQSKTIYIVRPDLGLPTFLGKYHNYGATNYTYSYTLSINNSTSGIPVLNGDTTKINIYLDNNKNNQYDASDILLSTYYYTKSINTGQTVSYTDTFNYNQLPDATKSIFAVINASESPNCNCTDTIVSSMFVGLPVNLMNFKASLKVNEVELNWQTASEENSEIFEVYRAKENDLYFVKIGYVKAKGYSSIITTYQWVDDISSISTNIIYYRLKMIDQDGAYKWSETRKVELVDKDRILKVYPNPTMGSIHIVIETYPKKFRYSIINSLGIKLLSGITDNQQSIPILDLSNGVYFVTVNIGDETYTQRVILIK